MSNKDFPREAEGLAFVVKSVTVALVALVAYLFIANPMAGNSSSTTSATVHHSAAH